MVEYGTFGQGQDNETSLSSKCWSNFSNVYTYSLIYTEICMFPIYSLVIFLNEYGTCVQRMNQFLHSYLVPLNKLKKSWVQVHV